MAKEDMIQFAFYRFVHFKYPYVRNAVVEVS